MLKSTQIVHVTRTVRVENGIRLAMDTVFDSLPPEYVEAVRQAQVQHGIGILPLQDSAAKPFGSRGTG